MGLLNRIFAVKKLDSPVVYKEKQSSPELPKLEALLKKRLPVEVKEQIQQDIQKIKAGDYGEKQVKFTLSHSYMPMYILHDVYLKQGNLTAQIDFLVITRKLILVIECKNYGSDVRIDKNGQFLLIRDGSKQGIPDPTEQNRRHSDMLCHLRPELKKRCIPLVVFTNEKSILRVTTAPESIKKQVLKLDKLVNHIRTLQETLHISELSDSEMKKYADFFLHLHTENLVDYTAKYQKYLASPKSKTSKKEPSCPHCKKPVRKGVYGWYCSGKCGMKIDKVYGTALTDTQVSALLNGKSTKCQTKAGMTSVLPEIEENSYQGTVSFQWKTKLL